MKTEYFYLRYPKISRPRWIPCTKERAERRLTAAMGNESFYNFVASVTETEDSMLVRDIQTEDFPGLVSVTLKKEFLYGAEDKAYRAQIALDIFHSAIDCFQNYAMRQ